MLYYTMSHPALSPASLTGGKSKSKSHKKGGKSMKRKSMKKGGKRGKSMKRSSKK